MTVFPMTCASMIAVHNIVPGCTRSTTSIASALWRHANARMREVISHAHCGSRAILRGFVHAALAKQMGAIHSVTFVHITHCGQFRAVDPSAECLLWLSSEGLGARAACDSVTCNLDSQKTWRETTTAFFPATRNPGGQSMGNERGTQSVSGYRVAPDVSTVREEEPCRRLTGQVFVSQA